MQLFKKSTASINVDEDGTFRPNVDVVISTKQPLRLLQRNRFVGCAIRWVGIKRVCSSTARPAVAQWCDDALSNRRKVIT